MDKEYIVYCTHTFNDRPLLIKSDGRSAIWKGSLKECIGYVFEGFINIGNRNGNKDGLEQFTNSIKEIDNGYELKYIRYNNEINDGMYCYYQSEIYEIEILNEDVKEKDFSRV